MSAARRHAQQYLYTETEPARRQEIFDTLLVEEAEIRKLPARYRMRIREEEKLMALLREAHRAHEMAQG